MNIANVLTLSRFGFSALFVYFIFSGRPMGPALALGSFLLGCLTDYIDGWIARSLKQITPFGQLVDPIADKTLNFSAFFSFAILSIVPWWIVIVMLTREIFVTFLRVWGLRKAIKTSAESLGKLKTVLQDAVIVAVLVFLILDPSSMHEWWVRAWRDCIFAGMLAVLVLTVYSGISYTVSHFRRSDETPH